MRRSNTFACSDFYCVKCGKRGIPIPRKGNGFRAAGHLKKLYCVFCGEETNHCEIRPVGHYILADFQEEFELGRFTEDGQRVETADLERCGNRKCRYNKHGRCWNANHSYSCEKRNKKKEHI